MSIYLFIYLYFILLSLLFVYSSYLELEYVDPFLKKKTYEDVMVTYSQEPDHFWCQLLSSENELNDLMDKIHYHCSALGPTEGLMDKFGLGLPCLALCTDQCWYRAKITGRTSQSF